MKRTPEAVCLDIARETEMPGWERLTHRQKARTIAAYLKELDDLPESIKVRLNEFWWDKRDREAERIQALLDHAKLHPGKTDPDPAERFRRNIPGMDKPA